MVEKPVEENVVVEPVAIKEPVVEPELKSEPKGRELPAFMRRLFKK
jgi:hypothetical protein